ncbi:MAG: Rid family hydrolase [Acidimicrobiia bacterium]
MPVEYSFHPEAPAGVPAITAKGHELVVFAGGLAADPVSGIPDAVRPLPNYPYHGSSIDRQLRVIYGQMADALSKAGSNIKRVMKINSFHTVPAEVDTALRLRHDYFDVQEPPPSTLVFVPEVASPTLSVTNDVIALTDGPDRSVLHQEQSSTPLPVHDSIYGRPIFTQAARGGGLIFTSGLTAAALILRGFHELPEVKGLLPKSNDFPYRLWEIKFQTRLILAFLANLLGRMDTTLADVVKAEIHMSDASDIAGMSEAWEEFFPSGGPARTIYPADLAPTNQNIEIELIVNDPHGPYHSEAVNSPRVPSLPGGEPHAVRLGPYVFLSGLEASDYTSGVAAEASPNPGLPNHSSAPRLQARYIRSCIGAICEEAGSDIHSLLRRRIFHTDLVDAGAAEDAWLEDLGPGLPPTTIFKASNPLNVPGCVVGYDVLALADGGG